MDSAPATQGKRRQQWGKTGVFILLLAVLLGGALRFYDLSGPSFSEDELFKVNAVNSYRAGKWAATGDDEHPMLMKLLIYTAFGVRDVWNKYAAGDNKVLELGLETVTRGPNALFGTLMILVLAFLGRELFSRRVGLIVAMLWAVEVNVIGYSRIAKEDTLLSFFIAWALYFVLRAKHTAEDGDEKRSRRYEIFAAMALGAMCASKYFWHLAFIVPVFYALSRWSKTTAWHVPGMRWLKLFGVIVLTFVVLNPTAFHPDNLSYISKYIGHRTVYHHGLLFMDELHMNNIFEGLSGTPWYFYFVYLGVKLPLPFLFAAVFGLGLALWRRREEGPRLIFTWLVIWLCVHAFLSGAKWGRFVTHLMPPVLLLAALGLDKVSEWASNALERMRLVTARAGLALGIVAVPALAPALMASYDSAPHYRMHLNAFGGSPENLRRYFPHCDFYDVGLREAVQFVCASAEKGAQVRVDAPETVRHYVRRCKRDDIKVTTLSKPGDECQPGRACYQILQVGRSYFETQKIFSELHARRPPDAVVRARGVNVAEIYGPRRGGKLQFTIFNAGQAQRLGALARAFGNAASEEDVVTPVKPTKMFATSRLQMAALRRSYRFASDVVVEKPVLPPREGAPHVEVP